MATKKDVEKNELTVEPKEDLMCVEYQSPYGLVKLDKNIIRKHFTKGNAAITDSEILMHLETCKRMRLDPYVTGEVHLVKYGDFPASTVIGYNTYKRRAEESPSYKGKEDGIIVQRGNEVIKKEGACPWPTEKLIGGWCKVKYMRGDVKSSSYKEVAFSEYSQENRQWRGKPAMMINKVAVAQALRDAFPTEMQGAYIPEEIASRDVVEGDFKPVVINQEDVINGEEVLTVISNPLTTAERTELAHSIFQRFGRDKGAEWFKSELEALGMTSSKDLTREQADAISAKLEIPDEADKKETAPETDKDAPIVLGDSSVLDTLSI